METLIRKVNTDNPEIDVIKQAADIIKKGGLVGFPTETVYGLGADALNPDASRKIYAAKGRPSDNPLIVHVADIEGLEMVAKEIPDKAKKLIDRFWPGPLTLIFKKKEIVPNQTTGNLDTVAVRMPNNNIALRLIKMSCTGIAAPSGNISGRPSPTIAEHMIDDMDGKIDMIIDGGSCEVGLESTIVDMTGDVPQILRPGAITLEMIKKEIGEVTYDPAVFSAPSENIKPKAPGMKYRHYAPKADFTMFQGEAVAVSKEIIKMTDNLCNEGKKVGIITSNEHLNLYEGVMPGGNVKIVPIGFATRPETIASNLYRVLRDFDKTEVEYILGETFEDDRIGKAIMNRLIKAAGYKIVTVK